MFNKARIKLTAGYTLTIMLISLSFSLVVYRILDREVDRFARMQRIRMERQMPIVWLPPPAWEEINPELLAEARGRIIAALIAVNSGILLLAGISGYLLAGRTLQPIAEMVEEQNRFVGDASHELRTPLTSLKSTIEVFLRDKKATLADSRQLARESLAEINRIQSLSDAMLRLAQSGHSRQKPDFSPVETEEIINRAVSRIQPTAKIREVKIVTENKADFTQGNQEQLTDMLVILLDNAVKYSHRGGEVRVRAVKADQHTEISVSDTGTGIDEKDLPHIFERFYRTDAARSREDIGGYGLGLPIARKIAGDHKGKIEAVSQLGRGSTFTVTLPTHPEKGFIFS